MLNKFKTKKALTEYVRELIKDYDVGDYLYNNDFIFMMELLKNHDDYENKVGCGVVGIVVNSDNGRKGNKYFCLVREDQSTTDFSWVKCINKCKNTQKDKFNKACRFAITEQILNYRESQRIGNKIKTENGNLIDAEDVHIDHIYQFSNIVNNFITNYAVDIEKVEFLSQDNQLGTRFKDSVLENEFKVYHQRVSKLRAITIKENLSRKRK